MCV
ncbi:unnamed protein product, partial [Didymodactylos carnosus]|jgi:hypothetical protein